jgi:cytoskeletal protein CcmA (bactofilin family)
MANKYIKDLTSTTTPSLTGYTIFDNGTSTFKTTLETLKDTIVDGESHTFEGDQTINGDLIVTGSITAKEFIVSSSVTYVTALAQSGSTVFGDSRNDTHRITGSVRITGSITLDGSIIVDGVGLVKESLFVSGFQVIGTPTHHSGSDPEVLHVGSYNSYNIAHFNANHDNYAQVNIKNVNSGTTASTDLVLTADNGTEETYYVNLGINSSGYGAGNVGSANDGYLINKGSDLYIGTLSGDTGHNHVHLYTAGNWQNPAFTVFDNHCIGFNTQTLGPSDKYVFSGNTTFKNEVIVTGSLKVNGFTVLSNVTSSFNNDTEAEAGGVPLQGLYRSGSHILIRLT